MTAAPASMTEPLPAAPIRGGAPSPRTADWILFLAGFCLIFLQFFMIREVTALMRGTELVILLVTLAYFSGYSVGYGVAGRLSFERIRALAIVALLIHLTLPFSFRYIGALFTRIAAGAAFIVLLFLTSFVLSSFYSILLPRFIDQAGDQGRSMLRYYSLELAGAIAGVLALGAVAARPWLAALLYEFALAVLVGLLWGRRTVWALAAAGVVVYGAAFAAADRASLEYGYAAIQELESPRMIYTANTFYQRVDIVEDRGSQRYIYLNGRMNYGSIALKRFNVMLAELPATLVRPARALIVGSGSMASVRAVSPHAGHVTTVELDAAVIEGSRRYLADVNHIGEIRNWDFAINDAKNFLGSTGGDFDLIVMDVPAPTTIQLGLLHSVEFYRLARHRLAPRGVIAVSLSGLFGQSNQTTVTVAAALLRVFPNVVVYTADDAGRSFAIAGESLPFTVDEIVSAAAAIGTPELDVYTQPEVEEVVGETEPLSADNMGYVVRRSWERVQGMFRREESGDTH